MKKVNSIVLFSVFLFLLNACASKQYIVKNTNGYLVEMNSRFDDNADLEMFSIVETYKNRLDAEMMEVVGEAAQPLTKSGTQSLLACFTADAMQEYVTVNHEKADFAVINNGGLRTTLNKGPVTIGNLYEIYTFENRIVLIELQGKYVKQLFDGFAQKSMEGFSKSVQLKIKDKKTESLMIDGKPLDENAIYKVVTVDYLAEGNDGMQALTQAANYNDLGFTLRYMMIEYIKKLTAENIIIYAKPDGRIEIEE